MTKNALSSAPAMRASARTAISFGLLDETFNVLRSAGSPVPTSSPIFPLAPASEILSWLTVTVQDRGAGNACVSETERLGTVITTGSKRGLFPMSAVVFFSGAGFAERLLVGGRMVMG